MDCGLLGALDYAAHTGGGGGQAVKHEVAANTSVGEALWRESLVEGRARTIGGQDTSN